MNDLKLIPDFDLPQWFEYPEAFLNYLSQYISNSGLLDLGPSWQILTGELLLLRDDGLKKNFPRWQLVPFARRVDSDDMACWENVSFPAVQVVHDYCSPKYARREIYPSFEAWVEAAQSETE
ncbi:MAG: hypothetical protein AAGE05_11095 [Pseudomonadota bacterium]